jgi:hypothetical protein
MNEMNSDYVKMVDEFTAQGRQVIKVLYLTNKQALL